MTQPRYTPSQQLPDNQSFSDESRPVRLKMMFSARVAVVARTEQAACQIETPTLLVLRSILVRRSSVLG